MRFQRKLRHSKSHLMVGQAAASSVGVGGDGWLLLNKKLFRFEQRPRSVADLVFD
jgi:hypothetical protein